MHGCSVTKVSSYVKYEIPGLAKTPESQVIQLRTQNSGAPRAHVFRLKNPPRQPKDSVLYSLNSAGDRTAFLEATHQNSSALGISYRGAFKLSAA